MSRAVGAFGHGAGDLTGNQPPEESRQNEIFQLEPVEQLA